VAVFATSPARAAKRIPTLTNEGRPKIDTLSGPIRSARGAKMSRPRGAGLWLFAGVRGAGLGGLGAFGLGLGLLVRGGGESQLHTGERAL
jgi:hypothetical protein